MQKLKIGGMIHSQHLALVGVLSVPDHPGVAGQILEGLGKEGINVQMIVESADQFGRGDIAFCIDRNDLEKTLEFLSRIQASVGSEKLIHHSPVGMISIFGPHFREKPAIAGMMFSALGRVGINILAISTSISTLSCVVPEELLPKAVQAIHSVFELP